MKLVVKLYFYLFLFTLSPLHIKAQSNYSPQQAAKDRLDYHQTNLHNCVTNVEVKSANSFNDNMVERFLKSKDFENALKQNRYNLNNIRDEINIATQNKLKALNAMKNERVIQTFTGDIPYVILSAIPLSKLTKAWQLAKGAPRLIFRTSSLVREYKTLSKANGFINWEMFVSISSTKTVTKALGKQEGEEMAWEMLGFIPGGDGFNNSRKNFKAYEKAADEAVAEFDAELNSLNQRINIVLEQRKEILRQQKEYQQLLNQTLVSLSQWTKDELQTCKLNYSQP